MALKLIRSTSENTINIHVLLEVAKNLFEILGNPVNWFWSIMTLKSRLLIGIIILVLVCSPLATSYASIQDDDRPRFQSAKVDGLPFSPTSNNPLQLYESIDIELAVDPVVDTTNNKGYVGTINVRLWWKHDSMNSYLSEPDQTTQSYEATTTRLYYVFTIGPMDESSYPYNLGAGQIYWYAELEVDLDKFDYYGSPQTPFTNIYFVTGVTTTQPVIQAPSEPEDPFMDFWEDIGLGDVATGFMDGLNSIGGNPVLILLVIAIGGVISFLIISGRSAAAKQRGAPVKRKVKRKSKKQSKNSIRSLARRFSQ